MTVKLLNESSVERSNFLEKSSCKSETLTVFIGGRELEDAIAIDELIDFSAQTGEGADEAKERMFGRQRRPSISCIVEDAPRSGR